MFYQKLGLDYSGIMGYIYRQSNYCLDQECHIILACEFSLQMTGQYDILVLKNAKYTYLYMYWVNFLHTIYEPLWHIEYIHVFYHTIMIRIEWSQPGLHCPGSYCW